MDSRYPTRGAAATTEFASSKFHSTSRSANIGRPFTRVDNYARQLNLYHFASQRAVRRHRMRTMRTLLACLILTTGAAALRAAEPEERTLTLKWKDRFLEICGPHIPGGPIRTHYLEAYCRPGSTNRDWKETVIPHESRLVSAADDGKRIEIEDKLDDGVIVTHVIQARDDEVQFTLTATNPTDTQSLAHWAQPCMRVDGFVGA